MTKTMSAKQAQWLHHVKAADIASESIADYALANNLRLKSLYQWKSKFIKPGLYQPEQQGAEHNFVEVKPIPSNVPQSSCTLTLANGNRIEFHAELSAISIRSIISTASCKR